MAEKTPQIGENGEILRYNRRTARDLAFKYVFQWNVIGSDIAEVMEELYGMHFKPVDVEYIKNTVKTVIENKDMIDGLIEENSKGWKKDRLSSVCLAILRVALAEMYFMDDIPDKVSINEAIELAKTYDTPEVAVYVNGVLGKIQAVKE